MKGTITSGQGDAMIEVTVRKADGEDVDALAPLFDAYRQFYQQPRDIDAAKSFLSDRLGRGESTVFVAHAGGALAGFTQLYASFSSVSLAPILILNDLYVVPSARRHGVGQKLLDAAVAYARTQGAIRLTLSTASTNTTAQSLYERAGWKRDERFWTYHYSVPDTGSSIS